MIKIFRFPEIRKKIFFTLFVVVIFRLLAHIPVPGVDVSAIRSFLQGNVFFGFLDLFSGGGFQNFSIVTLGLGPYINVSIIIQLFTVMIPALEELQKEGESGREKINMYTRVFTVPMALIQSYGLYFILSKQKIIGELSLFDLCVLLLTMTAGAVLLVWIGELITEYGVGNGISLIIFVGIISRLPASVIGFLGTVSSYNVFNAILFAALSLAVIVGVVLVNEGVRNIVIEYGRHGVRSNKVINYFPVKVNQVGMIPIIFAVSVIMIPGALGRPLQLTSLPSLQNLGAFLVQNFGNETVAYNILYFLLVVGFTFFYTFVQFNPEKIADDIKKRGGFIPGIRPGKMTETYLRKLVGKITLAGALFLGVIAILPYIVRTSIGVGNLSVGGAGLIIVVSVVLETVRQVESLTVTRSYESYLR
jgi:preprotein translocase subunit SecY